MNDKKGFSLRTKLIILILLFSVVPILFVGWWEIDLSYDSLKERYFNQLESEREIKKFQILEHFAEMKKDISFVASLGALNSYMVEFEALGLDPDIGFNSPDFKAALEEYHPYLNDYARGFADMYLISNNGTVVYSLNQGKEFGKNIFLDVEFKKSGLKRIYGKALKGEMVFEDFSIYKPGGGEPSAFIATSIKGDSGKGVGIIVFRLSIDPINKIMTHRIGLGETGETYLVGSDNLMRSDAHLDPEGHSVKASLAGTINENGVDTVVTNEALSGQTGKKITIDYNGNSVLSAFTPVQIFDTTWVLLAEIDEAETFKTASRLRDVVIILLLISIFFVFVVAVIITKRIVKPINLLSDWTKEVAQGKLDRIIEIKSKDELGELAASFNKMTQDLKNTAQENEKQNWLKTGQAELSDRIRGEQDQAVLAHNIIVYIAKYLNAQIGAVYLADEKNVLKLVGSYAYTKRKNLSNEFKLGEGLVGQAALEKQNILVSNVPDDYIKINSGLGEADPHNILVAPFLYEGRVTGVMEFGSFQIFTDTQMELLNSFSEQVAIAFNTAQANRRTQELLEKTQIQAEELQSQQEELRMSNEELEERAEILERQKKDIQQNNSELAKSERLIKEKAEELEITGKYKSEFLANMSHELRTPLNSLLILSKLLSDNKEGNLTDKQVECARTVNAAGGDLLALINDILDLSKVESGKMKLNSEEIPLENFPANIKQTFMPLVQEKHLSLDIDLAENLPATINTDIQRVNQIIKNLLSNAVKFTHKGGVKVKIHRPSAEVHFFRNGLEQQKVIGISISDTGIGIPKDKQKLIFEAFQQVDGSTSRKYGGTGLGLSISRELAKFLGGEIHLQSREGQGSTFTLYLPETLSEEQKSESATLPGQTPPRPVSKPVEYASKPAKTGFTDKPLDNGNGGQPAGLEAIRDDRREIRPGDRSILIIEDDPKFSRILIDLLHEKGAKCLNVGDGETGLQFADYYKPDGIILDISLPGIDGWTVMERLKGNSDTRNIPVHFISGSEENIRALEMGAIGFLTKPVDMETLKQAFKKIENIIYKDIKRLLVVEDNQRQRDCIIDLVKGTDVQAAVSSTVAETCDYLKSGNFDCIILDPSFADKSGFDLLEMIKQEKSVSCPPIVVYNNKELTEQEEKRFHEYSKDIVIKKTKSPAGLLDEIVLFLHLVEKNLPKEKQKMLKLIHDKESVFTDKKILIVDDDIRNVFALTSVLEDKGVKILGGQNGREALECLDKNPDVDLVLMDIMMPEMDGYEATRRIREQERFKNLPIITITAKAMKGDKNRCIEAGANDYISKPVDTNKLLSVLRVWLYHKNTE